MFDRCCKDRSTITYKIEHDPKPIPLSDEMDVIIKNLLWYVPNIDSYQAIKNDLIQDKIYDDFSFTYIIHRMGMDERKDVKWLEPSEDFDEEDWLYYENEICCNCQKIIITRQKNLSKTNDLLRCIRNCIAHGHFAVIGNYFIGFNRQITKNHPEGIKKAIIKIKPDMLLDALKQLTRPMGKELLVGYAFERIGYRVKEMVRHPSYNYAFDYVIEKDNRKYVLDIKDYQGKGYLHRDKLEKFLMLSGEALPGTERVLFIDTARITKDARKLEDEVENFRIVDLTQVKQLLNDPPVDILA